MKFFTEFVFLKSIVEGLIEFFPIKFVDFEEESFDLFIVLFFVWLVFKDG